jgi:hypothetical protein
MKILGFALSDYGWLLQIANILALAIGGWAALWMRQKFVAQAEFMAVIKRIVTLETNHQIDAERIPTKREVAEIHLRLLAVEAGDKLFEERMKSLATKDDVSQLLQKMERQDGDRRALNEKVSGIDQLLVRLSHPIDTIYKHMLHEGKS